MTLILSGVDAIMSSMISNSTAVSLTQEQFNQSMLITNWLDIIFLVIAGLIQVFSNTVQGTLNKYTAHKTKTREYMNILQVDFDNAYSDKVITSDEMQIMNNLKTQYESEQMQISLSGSYYTTNGSAALATTSTASTSVNIPLVQPTTLNPTQQSFLTILENLPKNSPSVL